MLQNKKNILNKIVKKNYNDLLEEILEKKQFKENVKNILLSILYKIETSYNDLETVKRDVESKDEYILKIISIIEKKCDSIEIIKMTDEQNKIPNGKTYMVDKKCKEIISYPIERKLLYAIAKIAKKDKIIKNKYFVLDETMSNLINAGNNIEMIEPLRDFNGYSWNIITQEIESIDHNLLYQNTRLLIGHKFLENWIKDEEIMIDYLESFQEKLEEKYGMQISKKYLDLLFKISILLELKFNNNKLDELLSEKQEIEKSLNEMKDNTKFIENVTIEKRKIEEKIRKIDTVVKDKEKLEKEYKTRNEQLPLEKKIFSMRILSKIMQDERDELVKEIEKLNEVIIPKNFVEMKRQLEEREKYLEVLDQEDKESYLDELKIDLQKTFLDMFYKDIKKIETKQEAEKKIYDLRYYLLLPYDKEKSVKDEKRLNSQIKKIENALIQKSIEMKTINKISDDLKINYEILKNVFTVRIINLNNAYLKITKEKIKKQTKFYLQIFDENIFEEKLQIKEEFYENNIFRSNKNSYRFKLFS